LILLTADNAVNKMKLRPDYGHL